MIKQVLPAVRHGAYPVRAPISGVAHWLGEDGQFVPDGLVQRGSRPHPRRARSLGSDPATVRHTAASYRRLPSRATRPRAVDPGRAECTQSPHVFAGQRVIRRRFAGRAWRTVAAMLAAHPGPVLISVPAGPERIKLGPGATMRPAHTERPSSASSACVHPDARAHSYVGRPHGGDPGTSLVKLSHWYGSVLDAS